MKRGCFGVAVGALVITIFTVEAGYAQSVEGLVKQSGCFECHAEGKGAVGPTFRDIASRYNADGRGYDLRFMTVGDVGDLPDHRKSQIIIARVGDDLHVRVFDSNARRIVDKSETDLAGGKDLATLKRGLAPGRFPVASALPREEKEKLIQSALSVAGLTPASARGALVDAVKRGSKGNWTERSHGVPMPPFSARLSDEQIMRVVDWILLNLNAAELRVMKMGLGSGTVTSTPAGISCGADCDETYSSPVTVTLTATPAAGSVFSHWEGDGTGTANTVSVTMNADRSVRAVFNLAGAATPIADFTPGGLDAYLTANPAINTPGRFLNALPSEYKRNWILMSRSESLQTGTAEYPRLLLPSANALSVFSVALSAHPSYPGADPRAIEYMQWDASESNFRFHEVVVDGIPATGAFPARTRGVSVDDSRCAKCHSTQNVLNRSSFPGTTGIPAGTVKAKNKPNWDTYDSWGGMMPFNRDRIYQGSVEAAAFRKIFNPWTWRTNDSVRTIIEQLELQPPGVVAADQITRTVGGTNDGQVNFAFDILPPVLTEPVPVGTDPAITTSYSFDGTAGTGTATSAVRGGSYVTLHHSGDPTNVEGRGVQLFDLLGGADGGPNRKRIVDELTSHRFATSGVPIDVRPVALAITKGLITRNAATDAPTSTPSLAVDLSFFNARNGMGVNQVRGDTETRARSIPRRKADIEKVNFDRAVDVYVKTGTTAVNGLVQQYGAATSAGTDTSIGRLREEVFRRPNDLGFPDATVMGGIYVDRELANNFEKVALFRYFLEPLGVSVDKWSMGVRGRSRTYSFADVFGTYINDLTAGLTASLLSNPVPGLTDPTNDTQLIAAVNATLSSLPAANAIPTFTDVQRIFNKSCVECHGGLNYPPYANYGTFLDLSEDESPPAGDTRLKRSHDRALSYTTADPATSLLYLRITATSEQCPSGLMPCGGPALSKVDTETIRRWIVGGRPSTVGDPHIRTVDGVNYDFQAAGEFVFLRGDSLEIQVRHTAVSTEGPLGPNAHTGLASCVSVNSAVAVRIGRHRVTYQPNLNGKPDPDGLQLRVDGELRPIGAGGIPLSPGGRIVPTIAPGGIQIEAPGGTVIVITPGWWDHYQLWYLNVDARNVRETQGLMGTVPPGNWLPALPDGSLMGPRPEDLQQRYRDLYTQFGNAWRVTDAASLFDYAPGTSTKTFTVENWPAGDVAHECKAPEGPGGTLGKPPLKPLALEVAKRLAADIVDPDQRANCERDLLTTGEAGFAKTYLLADRIKRNRAPAPPVLAMPADFTTGLSGPVTFAWKPSTDQDGDSITYREYVWPVNETPDANKAVVVARAASNSEANTFSARVGDLKPGKAYFWKVIAEDGKGGTAESEIRRFEFKQ